MEEGRKAREAARLEAERDREAEENRLRNELEHAKSIREGELRMLRKTRLALAGAVIAGIVAGIALLMASEKARQANESARNADVAKNEMRVTRDSMEISLRRERIARQEADVTHKELVDNVVGQLERKANSYWLQGHLDMAISTLDSALKVDSTRIELRERIKSWSDKDS